jgi:hypothetical protein
MKPPSLGRFPRGMFLIFLWLLVVVGIVVSQPRPPSGPDLTVGSAPPPTTPFNYVGAYSSDGTFRASSRSSAANSEFWRADSQATHGLRPSEVPPFIDLEPLERVVEDYEPPAHATRQMHVHNVFANIRDHIVTFAYGRERALVMPRHVTVDSRGRTIVSDVGLGAVHVLDGKNSFRIPAGPNRRLRAAVSVAVDAEDNIYVADPERGLVVVFDPSGGFLRNIGKIGDESLFHAPTAIAIDRAAGHIYLLDTPRGMLFVLDLQGNILNRVGKCRGLAIGRTAGVSVPMALDEPTAIALGPDRLAVLDYAGSRVRVMNRNFEVLSEFSVRPVSGREPKPQIALGFDSERNLYVSNAYDSMVRIYDEIGHLAGSIGHTGTGIGEFNQPSGLWIDAADRVYVADTNNRRIQIFERPAEARQAID